MSIELAQLKVSIVADDTRLKLALVEIPKQAQAELSANLRGVNAAVADGLKAQTAQVQTAARAQSAAVVTSARDASRLRLVAFREEQQGVRETARTEQMSRRETLRTAREAFRNETLALRLELAQQREMRLKAAQAARLYLRQQAKDAQAAQKVSSSRRKLAGSVSTGLVVGGGLALGAAGYAAEKASGFQNALLDAKNNTVMAEAEYRKLGQTVLEIGRETGASLDGLAQGFMRAKNHAFDLNDSMKIVRAAAMSAVATNSDVAQTANVLSQTMHIFDIHGKDALAAMATLHTAANIGNMTAQEFVDNFGEAEAVAAGFGLKLNDVAAVFSAMTENGLNAAVSGTQLRDVLQHIVTPSKSARAEIALLTKLTGVDLVHDFTAGGVQAKGLTGVLLDMQKATGGNAAEIQKLIPAQRGSFGAIVVTSKGAKDLADNYALLSDKTAAIARLTKQYQDRQETLKNKTDRLNNALIEMYVKVGPQLLPILQKMVDETLALIDGFNKLPAPVQSAIVKVVVWGGAIATALGLVTKLVIGVKDFAELVGGAKLLNGLSKLASLLQGRLASGTVGGLLARGGAALPGVAGGLVLAAPAIVAGVGAGAILNQQKAGDDARMRGFETFQQAPWINKIAELRQEIHHTAQGTAEFTKLLRQLRNTQAAFRHVSGADARGEVGVADGGKTGDAIAKAAWQKQLSLDRAAYDRRCQQLARETVQAITPAFNKYFSGSALKSLHNFQKAGLAKPFTPGMAVPAGSLLYSQTMGGGDGHVQVVGEGGNRYDQHGRNNYNLRNFQWYVPPPGLAQNNLQINAAPLAAGMGGASGSPALPNAAALAATQKAQDDLYALTHTEFQNRRHDAEQEYQQSLADGVKQVLARKLLRAQLADIAKDEAKEQEQIQADHHRKVEEAQRKHLAALHAGAKNMAKGIKSGAVSLFGDAAAPVVGAVQNQVALNRKQSILSQFGRDMAAYPGAADGGDGPSAGEAAWTKYLDAHQKLAAVLNADTAAADKAHAAFLKAFDLRDQNKQIAEATKALTTFNDEMDHKLAAATSKVGAQADPALASWQEYLAGHDALAKAVADDAEKAAAAFAKFKQVYQADQADTVTKQLQQKHGGILKQIAEQTARTPYQQFAAQQLEVGENGQLKQPYTVPQLKDMWKDQQTLQKLAEAKQVAGQIEQVLVGAFDNAYHKGFKGFFDSVITGFEKMLQQMAAQWLESQLLKSLEGAIGGSAAQGGDTGGGSSSSSSSGLSSIFGAAISSIFGGARASGGPVSGNSAYLVGEQGPELFVPRGGGSIAPNGQLAGALHSSGGGGITIHMNVQTPDAGSFRRSETQMGRDLARRLELSRRRG